jgi:plastocyanin
MSKSTLGRAPTHGVGWGGPIHRLARFAVGAALALGLLIGPQIGSGAMAANAHILAYGPLPAGNNPCGAGVATYCWQPSDFHVNSGDQVTWAMGSGNHGLDQLSTGSSWPSNCPKDQKYPTCSFSKTGVYRFQCSVHHEKMTGSVTVDFVPSHLQASPPPPGAPGAVPPLGGSPTGDYQALLPSASPSGDPSAADSSSANPTNSGGGVSPALLMLAVVVLLGAGGAGIYYLATRERG